jgi:hypothetical protein
MTLSFLGNQTLATGVSFPEVKDSPVPPSFQLRLKKLIIELISLQHCIIKKKRKSNTRS